MIFIDSFFLIITSRILFISNYFCIMSTFSNWLSSMIIQNDILLVIILWCLFCRKKNLSSTTSLAWSKNMVTCQSPATLAVRVGHRSCSSSNSSSVFITWTRTVPRQCCIRRRTRTQGPVASSHGTRWWSCTAWPTAQPGRHEAFTTAYRVEWG